MYQLNNDIDHIKLRKYSNRLSMSGLGMIIFSVWSVLRYVVMIIQDKQYIDIVIGDEYTIEQKLAGYIVLLIIFTVTLAIVVAIPIYIGRAAMKVGKGKKKKSSIVYIVLTVITLIALIVPYFDGHTHEFEYGLITTIVAIIIDITMTFACIEIIYCGIRVRMLDRKIQSREVK